MQVRTPFRSESGVLSTHLAPPLFIFVINSVNAHQYQSSPWTGYWQSLPSPLSLLTKLPLTKPPVDINNRRSAGV